MLVKVRAAAKKLSLLDDGGRLGELDSLSLIELVVELEAQTRVRIPTASLRQENFDSLESIARMLDDLAQDQTAR
jgi:acyl carrier protein